jgi:hypothetical protein
MSNVEVKRSEKGEGREMEKGANVTFRIPVWLDRICAWPVLWYRRRRYGYPYRRIYLGEGKWTIVDRCDYYTYGKYRWILWGDSYNFYAVRQKKTGPKSTQKVYMHREIMNFPKGKLVDHRNGDTLHNRRSNLRLATHTQNMQNRRKRKNTASKYVGMWRDKRNGQWVGRITVNKKQIYLGRFDSETAAAKAYDRAAKKYFGEFARLNFPEQSH